MSDDGFIDVLPPGKAGTSHAPCSMRCTEMGKQKARRLSMTFRLDLLDADAAHILRTGPRFNAAYNPMTKTLRLKADPFGRYETSKAPKTENVWLMRIPLPAGVHFCADRVTVEPDANRSQNAILIDLPAAFWPPVRLAGVPLPRRETNVTPGAMGDPPPGRSALDKRRAGND